MAEKYKNLVKYGILAAVVENFGWKKQGRIEVVENFVKSHPC